MKLSNKAIETRLRHLPNTIACGFHSGIPACCIHFYITKWMWLKGKSRSSHWKKMRAKDGIDINGERTGFGHIPCPACLKASNFVKLAACPKNANCHHAAEWSK